MKHLLARLMLVATFALPAYGVDVDEVPLDDPAKEAEARELMKEVRCLVCQNQSIEDSDADLARDLRVLIRERMAAGDDTDAVKVYLVERYGDWVLLKPPVAGRTLILWGSPLLILLLVAAGILMRRRAAPPPPLSADEEARLKALLEAAEANGKEPRG
ncbi:cytochrome c-type biogenesis protein [Gimibacter soli]|uniref:Cytochrome c-type biogenesis protein n=1 Tax=Gimibacter soli TaxID=3024400 RepID=A0AAE9XNU1_9PROT|nr:cytochrome c-type biogenesis protein [Gimibacter soli]WCL54458.1 cytochrome c-type biogenesis protein CcmH [Gimibacter soli]